MTLICKLLIAANYWDTFWKNSLGLLGNGYKKIEWWPTVAAVCYLCLFICAFCFYKGGFHNGIFEWLDGDHAYVWFWFQISCVCVCVYCTHIVHSVERYHPSWSENELLTTQAMLTLHQTIQMFMKLNKMVNLLLHCHRVDMWSILRSILRHTQTN